MTMGDHRPFLLTRAKRRNGLWNIFEGLDLEVLGNLGLSEEILKQLLLLDPSSSACGSLFTSEGITQEMDESHGQALLRALSAASSASRRPSSSSFSLDASSKEDTDEAPEPEDPSACCCERARLYRSVSVTVGKEIRYALQNRHRRNAVGNLFEILTPSQQLLLVEHLQAEFHGHSCVCDPVDSEAALTSSPIQASLSSPAPSSAASSTRPSLGEVVTCS